jgi:hypothetical protein
MFHNLSLQKQEALGSLGKGLSFQMGIKKLTSRIKVPLQMIVRGISRATQATFETGR